MNTERMGVGRRHTQDSAHWEAWPLEATVAMVHMHLPWRAGGFSLASRWSSKPRGWQTRMGMGGGQGSNPPWSVVTQQKGDCSLVLCWGQVAQLSEDNSSVRVQ